MNAFIERLERAYPWLLLAPVLLPIVVFGGFIYPYLVPKTLLFYIVSFITFAVFLILVAYGRPFYFARLSRKETWIPAALLAVAYIASYFGIDFYRSFWSLYVRGDGLLMYTCAVALFYLILLYADARFLARLVRFVAVIGAAVAVYGIGEWLVGGGGRIGSLLGNAAFFAGYLGVALFATLMAREDLRGGWRTAASWAAGAQVLAIILTATRGTILALLVALLLWLSWCAYRGEGRMRRTAAWTLTALVAVAGIFLAFRGPISHVPFEPLARIASAGLTDPDVTSRLFIWRNMAGEIKQHFFLGVGAEHIDVLFNRFYDPTLIREEWFDRSHNAFLDYFVQFGVAGFALYVMLIGAFFLVAQRFVQRGNRRLAALAALLGTVYAVQNFFVFDTVSSFWLMLALLAGLLGTTAESSAETLTLSSWTRPASLAAAVVFVLLIYPVSVRPAMAAYDLAHGYAYGLVDVPKEAAYLEKGYALGTYGDLEYGYESYDAYLTQMGRLSPDANKQAWQLTTSLLKRNFDRYTYDARTALLLAKILSAPPSGEPVDGKELSAALARAIDGSPKRAQSWYILANVAITQANENPPNSAARAEGYTAAADILNRYIALVPDLSEPYYVLADLELAMGKPKEAAAAAARGKANYIGDEETAKRAAVYYERVLDLPDAAFFLREVLKHDPGNQAAAEDLAKIEAYEQSQK